MQRGSHCVLDTVLLMPDLKTDRRIAWYASTVRICRRGWKWPWMKAWAERKVCACSSDLNRCTCRSRRRVGRCEFSRSVVIRHNLIDATGGLVKSQAAGCILGRPGQGRREHVRCAGRAI
jgi:hypothetical protein